MSFNVFTPERQAKIAQYLRMIQRRAPVWDPKMGDELKPDQEEQKEDTEEKTE